ncbi:hypothetical protein Tco_0331503, partial [Tanacetum coccineum]
GIEKVAVSSSLRSLKPKCTIESKAKRSSINLIRTLFECICCSNIVKTSNDLRVLRIILMILPEHQSDTKVIHNDDGNTSIANIKQALGRFNTTAGNTVKDILKLNLPDHRSILTDSKEYIKMDVERRSVKVKELQERCIIKAFKLSYQEKYEHVGPKSQDHKMARLQDDVKRLCLVDDLKKFKITFISSQRYKSKPKVNDNYNISQVKD